ncbi:MAG TPA: hypothetical protein VG986_14830 [Pseudolabrys sp.]|nr:hypothetical protein [Pseudolabrys sp.]
MKSIRCAHIVVVADSDQGLMLVARLRRMEVAQVTSVAHVEEARQLCESGGADACIVAFDDAIPDALPPADNDAPGRRCGVPTLMLVSKVTPYLRTTARRCGYLAALPAAIAPRMLYRRIGGALQRRRAARRARRVPISIPILALARPAAFAKPTLH